MSEVAIPESYETIGGINGLFNCSRVLLKGEATCGNFYDQMARGKLLRKVNWVFGFFCANIRSFKK
jgi:hypothetical protein